MIHGNTTLTMYTLAKLETIYLDIWGLTIEKVYYDNEVLPTSQIVLNNEPIG